MSTLGDRLRRARDRKKLTQKAVFEKIGITDKSLSRYENNKAEPDAESILSLSNLYDVSLDWLLGKESKKENAEAFPKSKLDLTVEQIERDLQVSIKDDPEIMEALESYLRTLGKMKKK